MLAAKGSLKLCETERPGGGGGVKTSSRKLRLPSQNGLAPDFTQPFSNLKLFTNTKQEPSAVGSHPQATTEKAKKCQRKKKKTAVSEDAQKLRLETGPPPPPHSLPAPGRAPRPGGLEAGAPAAASLPAIAPEPPPPEPTRRPSPNIRQSGAHIFPSLPTPTPDTGRNRRTFQKSNLPGAAVALASRHLPPPTPPPP